MTTQTQTPLTQTPWLPFEVPAGDIRLYCLPHAGGSASAFRPWSGRLGNVAVCPVQPPGRGTRLRDAPHTRIEPLVADLADTLLRQEQGPYAVYGHSLGALVGFELLREIRRRGGPAPVHFIVSGCSAPQRCAGEEETERVAEMTDAEVVGLLRRLGGTPGWMLADPTVLRMILPPFRADFSVKETYRYRTEPPLDVPITALAATDDPRADHGSVAEWRDQTSRRFRVHTMAGGHFAVFEQPETAYAHIRAALG
jgi:medium-chain acyl-[acyl-carrier-protein] hydrolase